MIQQSNKNNLTKKRFTTQERVYLSTSFEENSLIHYMTIAKIFMSLMTCLKNTRGWVYESSWNRLKEIPPNRFGGISFNLIYHRKWEYLRNIANTLYSYAHQLLYFPLAKTLTHEIESAKISKQQSTNN